LNERGSIVISPDDFTAGNGRRSGFQSNPGN
jgi:hypothetical protein